MADRNPTPVAPALPIAVGLVRCSTDMQEHSIEDQEAEIRAWAAEKGHRLVTIFRDEGVSGSDLDRPGIRSLLAYLESSPEQGTLVAWKRNRMARPGDPRQGIALELKIEDLGWRIHYLQDASPTGNALLDTILGAVGYHQAGEYLKSLSSDTLRGQVRHILRGGMTSGKIPYGYAKVILDDQDRELRRIERRTPHRKHKGEVARWVPGDPAEVEAVAWMFETYAADKHGLADLAADLNQRGLPAPEGGEWKSGTIRDILQNPIYTGDMVWNRETTSKFFRLVGGKAVPKAKARTSTRPSKTRSKTSYAANAPEDWIVVPDQHPPLVNRRTWERAQEVRRKRGRAQGGRRRVRLSYPMTGVAYCGNCGGRMVGHSPSTRGRAKTKTYRYRRYTCASYHQNRTCHPFQVSADELDNAVAERLRVTYEAAVTQVRRPELRSRLVRLVTNHNGWTTNGAGVDTSGLERERARLERKVANALDRMGDIEQPVVVKKLAAQIDEWSRRVDEIEGLLQEAGPQQAAQPSSDIDADVEEQLALLDTLGEALEEAPRIDLKAFFAAALERVELQFTVETPAQTGRKRNRLRFVRGSIRANPLLADTAQALAAREGSTGGSVLATPSAAGGVLAPCERSASGSVQANTPSGADGVFASCASSSGRIRTYDQVVNSHLLYR